MLIKIAEKNVTFGGNFVDVRGGQFRFVKFIKFVDLYQKIDQELLTLFQKFKNKKAKVSSSLKCQEKNDEKQEKLFGYINLKKNYSTM